VLICWEVQAETEQQVLIYWEVQAEMEPMMLALVVVLMAVFQVLGPLLDCTDSDHHPTLKTRENLPGPLPAGFNLGIPPAKSPPN
jgi:hypothetical protein